MKSSQRCLYRGALPNQFTGDTDMTQQCLDHNSPWERSTHERSNAETKAPLPTNHRSRHDHAEMPKSERSTGRVIISLQKCHADDTLPRQSQGVTLFAQKCHRKPAPTEFGLLSSRGNAIGSSPNNQRPVQTRRNANPPSPHNIKRKTNGQEIRKPNHRKDTVCMAQPPKHGQSRGQASPADQSHMPWPA